MTATAAILVTLVVYYAVLVAIGVFAQWRTRDDADFYLGGRRLGPYVASLSASASSSSAWTLLGVSGFAYSAGLSSLWILPACLGGFALNWFVVAGPMQRHSRVTGALTATDVLAGDPTRPGWRAIRVIAAAIILVSLTTYVASQFQAAGKSFSETFGLSVTSSVLIGSVVVIFYTLLGGFWAVSLTDALQGLLMAATAVVLPVAALLAIGPGELAAGLRAVETEGYLGLTRGMAPAAGLGFVLGLLGIGLGYPGQPHVVNRFMALRGGDREVRHARRVAIGWAMLVYPGMILLGLCARVLITHDTDAESVFIGVAHLLFHPVVAGVMIAAVLSAVMSTADSQLLVAASAVNHDLGVGGPNLAGSRLIVLALSAAAVVAALAVPASIFDRVLFAWSSMGCAFGPLLLVILLRGPVSAPATIACMLTGFGGSVAAYVFRADVGGWAGVLERVTPFVAAGAIAWWGSRRI